MMIACYDLHHAENKSACRDFTKELERDGYTVDVRFLGRFVELHVPSEQWKNALTRHNKIQGVS